MGQQTVKQHQSTDPPAFFASRMAVAVSSLIFLFIITTAHALGATEDGNLVQVPFRKSYGNTAEFNKVVKYSHEMQINLNFSISEVSTHLSQISPAIIGGYPAQVQTARHMAQIFIVQRTGTGICSASIANKNLLVSAAHCFISRTGELRPIVAVFASVGKISSSFNSVYVVRKIVVHESFNPSTLGYDIALLTLTGRIVENFSPVFFPTKKYVVLPKDEVFLAGFGKISNSGKDTTVLREVKLKVQRLSICSKRFNKYSSPFPRSRIFLCLVSPRGVRNGCYGDSGGPAFQKLGSKYVQVGIASFVERARCASPGSVTGVVNLIQFGQDIINYALNRSNKFKHMFTFRI